MVLFAIVGELGSGKTLALTYLAWKNWFFRRTKVYSTYHLYKIPYIFVDSIAKFDSMREGFVAGDEYWSIIDCTTPDTYIITENGAEKITDVISNNPVQSFDFKNSKIGNGTVSAVYKRPVRKNEKLFEVKTSTKFITVSGNHRFFIFNGENIVEKYAHELKKSDYLVTAKKINEPKYKGMDETLAQFLGYIFGDGTIYFTPDETHWKRKKAVIKADDMDKSILEFYGNLMKKYGLKHTINKHKGVNCYRMSICNRQFVKKFVSMFENDKNTYMSKWGLRFNDIPEIITKSNNKVLGSFLRGFFDAEGCIKLSEEYSKITADKKVIQTRIVISVSQHIDIEKLKYLLMRFGIRSTTNERIRDGFPIYNLTIKDRVSILNYKKHIGFSCRRKSKELDKCVDFIKKRKNQFNKSRNLPFQTLLKNLINSICEKRNTTLSSIEHYLYDDCKVGLFRKYFKYKIGRSVLVRVLNSLEKKYGILDEIVYIRSLINSNILFEKPKTIKKVKPKCDYLYEITVPKYNNYFANGFLVHNSRCSISRKNKVMSNILLRSRKRNLNYTITAQLIDSLDSRCRKVLDFSSYPIMNPQETLCKLVIFRGGYPKTASYLKTIYFRTAPVFSFFSSDEEVDISDSEVPTPEFICFQETPESKLQMFNSWEEADRVAEKYWMENQHILAEF